MSRESDIKYRVEVISEYIESLCECLVSSKLNLNRVNKDSLMQHKDFILKELKKQFVTLVKELFDTEELVGINDRINKITRRVISLENKDVDPENNPVTGKEQPNETRLFNQVKNNGDD